MQAVSGLHSHSNIRRKADGSFELSYDSAYSEAHYVIPADAGAKLAAGLGCGEAGIPHAWHRLLGEAMPHEYLGWLDEHGIPCRTIFVWY